MTGDLVAQERRSGVVGQRLLTPGSSVLAPYRFFIINYFPVNFSNMSHTF